MLKGRGEKRDVTERHSLCALRRLLLGLLSYLSRPASDLKSREISPFTRPTALLSGQQSSLGRKRDSQK